MTNLLFKGYQGLDSAPIKACELANMAGLSGLSASNIPR
jgi:hypothetical protein